MKVWTSFDLRSNLGLTRGILVILAEKGTSNVLMPKRVAPRHFGCTRGPREKRNDIFGFFGGPACKSRVDKIQYQQLPLLYLISRVQ